MRKAQKNNILEIIKTFYEAHEVIKKLVSQQDFDSAYAVLGDCQSTAIQLGELIETLEGEGFVTVRHLEEYCEELYSVSTEFSENTNGNKVKKSLDKKIIAVENSVKNDIKVKLEIVFMPYKVSMWDSLESIWMAADADENCDAYVVPIPYYDRNPDHSFGEFHYEGGDMPEYVPVTHYMAYNLEARRPDVIYIHNPYDGNNYVTSVEPQFYSHELKKHTECLVYVPYFVSGYYSNENSFLKNIPVCINNVDLYIVQSYIQKYYLSAEKSVSDKVIVLGSPKIDKIKNINFKSDCSLNINEIINGRKTIMVNSSISRILSDEKWSEQIENLLNIFENNQDIFMIWRPHPLLLSTIKAMRPHKRNEMIQIINKANSLNNVFVDTGPSALPAINISDALISDYSSLVLQYTATGKPILLTMGSAEYRNTKLVCGDYFSNYFLKDGISFEQFCLMVCENRDDKKEERIKYFNNSIVNADGTCGLKIHKYIKEFIGIK